MINDRNILLFKDEFIIIVFKEFLRYIFDFKIYWDFFDIICNLYLFFYLYIKKLLVYKYIRIYIINVINIYS